jgi:hypothetical protein
VGSLTPRPLYLQERAAYEVGGWGGLAPQEVCTLLPGGESLCPSCSVVTARAAKSAAARCCRVCFMSLAKADCCACRCALCAVCTHVAKLRKANIICVTCLSVCLSVRTSVCPSHETTRLPLDGFSRNLIFEYFSKVCRKIFKFYSTDTTIRVFCM